MMSSADTRAAERLLDEKRYDEALEECERLLRKHPGHSRTHGLKGLCCLRTNRLGQAEASFRTALGHESGNARLYALLGETLERLEREDEALEAYERSLRYDRNHGPGYHGRGRLRMSHLTDMKGALKDLVTAVELEPDNPEFWFSLGLCRLSRQEAQEAGPDFERAVSLEPSLRRRVNKTLKEYIEASDLPEA